MMKNTNRKKIYNRRSIMAILLAALVASTTIIPSFSDGGEIHLINDLGGYGGEMSLEAQAERDWNEDIVAVAKSAWLDAHAGEERERSDGYAASGSNLGRAEYIPASGSDLAWSQGGSSAYDVFEDIDDDAAASAVSSYLKKARKEERSKSGAFLRKMLKEAVIPEGGVPQDNDLKKEILALDKLNDDDYEVFRTDREYSPSAGDIIFVAGHISTGDESPASGSDIGTAVKSTAADPGRIVSMAVPAAAEPIYMEPAVEVSAAVTPVVIESATPSDLPNVAVETEVIISDDSQGPAAEIAADEAESMESEEAVPVEMTAPTEEAVPVELAAPAEEAIPAETAAPAEDAVPAQMAAPAVESIPAEIPVPAETAAPEANQDLTFEEMQEILAAEQEKALKRNAKNAVLAGIVIAGPQDTGSDRIRFIYSTASDKIEIGVISRNEVRIIGYADMEVLHDKYCGILEELEEEEEAEIPEEELLEEIEIVPNEKTEYIWKNDAMTVTATLTDPEAVPDDAELVVTPVTKTTRGYNYQAYMDALTEKIGSADEGHTILYDVAFLVDEKDENGEKTGRTIELQPENDKVNVTFRFNDAQLTESIGAKYAEKVKVVHLPLAEAAKETADTTKDAVNIAASDIVPESLDAQVAVGTKSGRVEFETEGFSVFAIVYTVKYNFSVDGETYTITVTYGEDAAIPENAELDVKEILPEDKEFDEYYRLSMEKFGDDRSNVLFSKYVRFFDIKILAGVEVIEPKSQVAVAVELKDGTAVSTETWSVVHFANNGTDVLDVKDVGRTENESVQICFDTDSFSVYGVITTPQSTISDGLNGRTATIGINNGNSGYRYMIAETVDENPVKIAKTADVTQAASWVFEAAASGQYYISTMVGDEKKYMHIYSQGGNTADITLSDSPQALNITRLNTGLYEISVQQGSNTYYVNQFSGAGGNGFAGYNASDANTKLTFTFPSSGESNKYAVIVKQGEQYYVVQNDGSLLPATYYPESGIVEISYPLLWEYVSVHGNAHPDWEPYNLRVPTEATGFAPDTQLPTGYYYRYIDPEAEEGISEENEEHPESRNWACALRYKESEHVLVGIQWQTDHFVENSYIGVVEENGKLHLSGGNNSDNAAEVYFAQLRLIPPPGTGTHDDHTVNHIDISIVGTSSVTIPLAYGDYYDSEGNVIYTATEEDHKIQMSKLVDITKEDIKRAEIKAFTKDENGVQTEVPNAFYITGYSGNAENDLSTPQVRIEGSFKVADLPTIPNADNIPRVREERLRKRIYYTVATVKEVEYTLEHDGEILYDSEGNPITISIPVTISSSFDYWDEDNECPPLVLWPENRERWPQGYICGEGETMSGMDFKLGTIKSETDAEYPAIEITKYIKKTDGTFIESAQEHTVSVDVFYNKTGNPDAVVGKGRPDPISQEDLDSLIQSGYNRIHQKSITVGESGLGMIYDYDVSNGMIFIVENEDSVPAEIADKDGNLYQYVETRMETEYAWRVNGDERTTHKANGVTSVPEVVGPYSYHDQELKNNFLEFYIYNIYEPVAYPVIIKKVDDADLAGAGLAGAKFDLYGPYASPREDDSDTENTGRKEIRINDASLETSDNGIVELGDLIDGYYYMYETEAPSGYIPASSVIGIHIDSSNSEAPVSYEMDGTEIDTNGDGLSYVDTDEDGNILDKPYYQLLIPNLLSVALPNTGGSGNDAVYFYGILLISIASVGLIHKRRKTAA